MLVLEMRCDAVNMGLQVFLHARSIFRVYPVKPFLGLGTDLIVLVAERAFPSRRKMDIAGYQVPIPDTVFGAREYKRIPLLNFAWRRIGTPRLRDFSLHQNTYRLKLWRV